MIICFVDIYNFQHQNLYIKPEKKTSDRNKTIYRRRRYFKLACIRTVSISLSKKYLHVILTACRPVYFLNLLLHCENFYSLCLIGGFRQQKK